MNKREVTGKVLWMGIYVIIAEKIRFISIRRARDEEEQKYNQGQ